MTPDTLFPLGSCSKAFTATAIALLADERRIALDAPVRAYLPDFSLQDPVASATLTTRDLLTHRSGLPRHDLFWYQAPFSRDELYRRLRYLEPGGPPHARYRYNSLMFVVAARIVEKVSGQSWESFVQERILLPLNMRRTVLSPEAMEADADHASPYSIREGSAREIPMLKGLNAIAPAGAVQSSVRDLARWIVFHATRSPEILGEEAWRDLHRPRVEMPEPDEPEVQHHSYALGWIHESYRGHTLVVHDGAIDGFTAHLGFVPETGQGLIILMNRERAAAALKAHRLQRLRSAPRARAAGLGARGSRRRRNRRRTFGMSRSTFRSRRWRGAMSILRTGCSRSGPMGDRLAMQFRDSPSHAGLSGRTSVSQPGTHRRLGPADLGSVLETEAWRTPRSSSFRSTSMTTAILWRSSPASGRRSGFGVRRAGRNPEPESESLLNHRRELAPWRGQPPHAGTTERPRSATAKWGESFRGAQRARAQMSQRGTAMYRRQG